MSPDITAEMGRLQSFSRKGGSLKRRDIVVALVDAGEVREAIEATRIAYGTTIYVLLEGGFTYRGICNSFSRVDLDISLQGVRSKALRLRAFGIPVHLSPSSRKP